ncbi:MAG: hypothetical protein ABH877_02685 [bacterium]|nr:hypothetical protein [Actinomycetota bacterium]MBU1942740.1 hypothetical protein [Actinomycetota bacterium]MBU2686062.1 hypothetical protein [Actinomycetota bacterium]
MAYCPACGKEQRCGCDRCHECGSELADRLSALPTGPAPPPGRPDLPEPVPAERGPSVPAATGSGGRDTLQAVLLVLGTALLLITVVEVMKTISALPDAGPTSSFAEMLKRAGYYIGTLLYTNSARSLTSVAFIAAGLLVNRPWPFRDEERWRSAGLAMGWAMWAVAALCLADVVLLLIPGGAQSSLVGSLLPPLWVAILVILVLGAALLVAGGILLGSASGLPLAGSRGKGARGEVHIAVDRREGAER